VHEKVSGASKGHVEQRVSPFVAKIRTLCIIQNPKRQFPWSYRLRALFLAFFSWMMCDAILFSVVLFLAEHDQTNSCHLSCHTE